MIKLTQEQRRQLYSGLLLHIFFFIMCILLLVFVVPPLFSLFAPFIFAFLMASILNPLVSRLNQKFCFPRKLAAFILVILVFSGLFSLIAWFLYTVISEAVSLASNIQSIWDNIMSALDFINVKLEWLLDLLPSDTEVMLDNIMDSIYQWLQKVSGNFLNSILSNTASITTKIGSGAMNAIIFILAAYFITAEYNTIGDRTEKYLGKRIYEQFSMLKNTLKSALGGYFKAQLLLALLAFVVMFPALAIYGQDYAFLIALFLAFIDFLPIIGTAAILVPWGLFEIAGGGAAKGIFLLILAAAFFVFRKIAEPKIVGSQTGLHPLIALTSIYLGLKLSGIWGAILGPIVTMIAIDITKSHVFDNTIKYIKNVYDDLKGILHRNDNPE